MRLRSRSVAEYVRSSVQANKDCLVTTLVLLAAIDYTPVLTNSLKAHILGNTVSSHQHIHLSSQTP